MCASLAITFPLNFRSKNDPFTRKNDLVSYFHVEKRSRSLCDGCHYLSVQRRRNYMPVTFEVAYVVVSEVNDINNISGKNFASDNSCWRSRHKRYATEKMNVVTFGDTAHRRITSLDMLTAGHNLEIRRLCHVTSIFTLHSRVLTVYVPSIITDIRTIWSFVHHTWISIGCKTKYWRCFALLNKKLPPILTVHSVQVGVPIYCYSIKKNKFWLGY